MKPNFIIIEVNFIITSYIVILQLSLLNTKYCGIPPRYKYCTCK